MINIFINFHKLIGPLHLDQLRNVPLKLRGGTYNSPHPRLSATTSRGSPPSWTKPAKDHQMATVAAGARPAVNEDHHHHSRYYDQAQQVPK
jgi:hypothetical protein